MWLPPSAGTCSIGRLQSLGRGGRPVADIEQGHISFGQVVLANLAMKLDRTLEWDAAAI